MLTISACEAATALLLHLQHLLHPDSFLQASLLQSLHLHLQSCHYAPPPQEGALGKSLRQVQHYLGVVTQELKELLQRQSIVLVNMHIFSLLSRCVIPTKMQC